MQQFVVMGNNTLIKTNVFILYSISGNKAPKSNIVDV